MYGPRQFRKKRYNIGSRLHLGLLTLTFPGLSWTECTRWARCRSVGSGVGCCKQEGACQVLLRPFQLLSSDHVGPVLPHDWFSGEAGSMIFL